MRNDDWQWFWILAAHVHKVDVESIECDPVLRELVQVCLLSPPVVAIPPVISQRLQISETRAQLPTDVLELVRPARGIEPALQIRNQRLRHIYRELFYSH